MIVPPNPCACARSLRMFLDDPLYGMLDDDADLGILGIELATRRRNRVNGQVTVVRKIFRT